MICRLRRRGASFFEIRVASQPRTFLGIHGSTPSLAERSDSERGSNADDPATTRRRAPRSEGGDAGTHAQNTLSANNPHVEVFYPFHPLRGTSLQMLRKPKRGDGAVCVIDPLGRRLK